MNLDDQFRWRAKGEEISVPAGFDERLEKLVQTLPERRGVRLSYLRVMLVAAAICVALLTSALALSPTLREVLAGALGSFGPYSSTVDGVSVTNNGIRVKVVSALADETSGTVYYEVTDLKGNRLDDKTTDHYLDTPACIAYDSEKRTALFSRTIEPRDRNGDGAATISIQAIYPGVEGFEGVKLPWELVTDKKLSSRMIEGKDGGLVLEPNQTPAELDTAYFSLSSMGFDSEGVFHIQIVFTEGMGISEEFRFWAEVREADYEPEQYIERQVVFEGGKYLDIAYENNTLEHFGHFKVDELGGMVHTRPAILGDWTLTFPLEVLPKRVVTSDVNIYQTRLVEFSLSAMTLRMETVFDHSDKPSYLGGFPVCLFLKDGAVVHLKYNFHWSALYQDANGDVTDRQGRDMTRYGAQYKWNLPRAVNPQDVVGISFGQLMMEVDGDAVTNSYWLDEVP